MTATNGTLPVGVKQKHGGYYELPSGKVVRGRAAMLSATNAAERSALNARFALLSEMSERVKFAQLHGLQYEDKRDIYKVGGYKRQLSFDDYAALYQRDGIAGSVVDMVAETTWRLPPEIVEQDRPDGTAFTEAWEALADRLSVWRKFEAADKLDRLGEFAIILVGVKGEDSSLEKPMPRLSSHEDVLYLSAFSQKYAEIEEWVTDPRDPSFGMPLIYEVNLTGDLTGFKAKTGSELNEVKVHASRIIHLAEGALDDNVYGKPVLQRVYNDLMDLQKIRTSTPEGFWQRVAGMLVAELDLFAGNADAEVTWSPEDLATLDETLKEMYHDLRRTAYISGGKFRRLGDSEPNPTEASLLCMRCIAAGVGIPMRMIFGNETGERSSSEDQKSYLGTISERQTTYAEPSFIRALIDKLIRAGALPKPETGSYDVSWPVLFRESELDIAKANLARAQAAQALAPVGGDPLALVEIDSDRNVWLIESEAGEGSPEPPPPLPPGGGETDNPEGLQPTTGIEEGA